QAPKSESPILYGSNVLRHSFALMALSQYNIATMLHSLVMIITNTIMTIIITMPKKYRRQHDVHTTS
ncbi:hypothetical protein KC901_03450, partial [Patescibacteria group bacterium]|nr:hypothetical protein [Patescibacteria group bacterium]